VAANIWDEKCETRRISIGTRCLLETLFQVRPTLLLDEKLFRTPDVRGIANIEFADGAVFAGANVDERWVGLREEGSAGA
jgi:hypothetical protein